MPIFEYRCRDCGNQSEQLVLSSSPAPICPACHSENLEKLMSASAVSSSETQRRSLKGAKQRKEKQSFEREWEAHKTAHQHHDD
jgi:putative FmdB family regulatory protein